MGLKLAGEVAEELAGRTWDVLVLGGGPAGLAAAMYAARFGLSVAILTKEVGGQLVKAGWVEDYLGFRRITGPDLARAFEEHVRSYGVPMALDAAVGLERGDGVYRIQTEAGDGYTARTVIVAVGERRRKLGVPGEDRFNARGVSYCAPCDAPLFRGKVVAVVGGGDAAAQAALLLAEYASKVYLIHRRDRLRAQPHYQRLVLSHPKVTPLWNTVVKELRGDRVLREAVLDQGGSPRVLPIDGIFIEIGAEPPAELFARMGLETDEAGYVKVGWGMETNLPGVFAAGDCTTAMPRGFKQIQIAAAHGAIAAYSAYNYLLKAR